MLLHVNFIISLSISLKILWYILGITLSPPINLDIFKIQIEIQSWTDYSKVLFLWVSLCNFTFSSNLSDLRKFSYLWIKIDSFLINICSMLLFYLFLFLKLSPFFLIRLAKYLSILLVFFNNLLILSIVSCSLIL